MSQLASLRRKQQEAITKMLAFNKDALDDFGDEDVWKVLIYDQQGSDIIAPLIPVSDLRSKGVTLFMNINRSRQTLSDVSAVYFVSPTRENIQRINQDCKAGLYNGFYLNFISSISPVLMDELASSLIRSNVTHSVKQVCDQFLKFISLEDDLFDCAIKSSYVTFNNPNIATHEADLAIQSVADSLFSVITTSGVIPIICCQRNGAAELVAQKIERLLREYLCSEDYASSSSSSSSSSFDIASLQRPLLIILDRNVDLNVMLQHPWNYQPLIHDLFSFRLNQVSLPKHADPSSSSSSSSSAASPASQRHLYTLDSRNDPFWSQHRASAFPDVAQAVDSEVKSYSSRISELQKLGISDDAEGAELDSQLASKTKDLKTFATNVSALKERKKQIDAHLNIATELLNVIKQRKIDVFNNLEESLSSGTSHSKNDIATILKQADNGTVEDKLRLLLIYFLSKDQVPADDLNELSLLLGPDHPFLHCLSFLKSIKGFTRTFFSRSSSSSGASSGSAASSSSSSPSSSASSSSSGSFISMLQGYKGIGKDLFSMVQPSLLKGKGSKTNLYLTRVVDAILENKPTIDHDRYCFYDPKHPGGPGTPTTRKSSTFRQAIVFVIGGGNYLEYQDLLDYASTSVPSKSVIYGSTEILTPNEFLNQLETLGRSISN